MVWKIHRYLTDCQNPSEVTISKLLTSPAWTFLSGSF